MQQRIQSLIQERPQMEKEDEVDDRPLNGHDNYGVWTGGCAVIGEQLTQLLIGLY